MLSFFALLFFLFRYMILFCFLLQNSMVSFPYRLNFLLFFSAPSSSCFLFEVSTNFSQLFSLLLPCLLCQLWFSFYLHCYMPRLALQPLAIFLIFVPLQYPIQNPLLQLHWVSLRFLRFALNFSRSRLKCSRVECFITQKWISVTSFSLFAISSQIFPRSTVLGLKRNGSLTDTSLAR